MPEKKERITLEADGLEVSLSSPGRVVFPRSGWTKLDVAEYYLAVRDGALRGVRDRPTVLKRFVRGVEEEPVWQKRVPEKRPEWLQTATVHFPSGRSATELAPADAAHLLWAVNLGIVDLNPWPVRKADLDHPDELRIDLDPTPEATWADVRRTALEVKAVLDELGLRGFPKTSGSRGIHVYVRIRPEHGFKDVRRAALAFARRVERRIPETVTTKWWKEERHGVFIDYNQNARDHTIASAYSIRPTPDARVSCPVTWDEVPDVEPEDLRIDTVPERVRTAGDPDVEIDDVHHDLGPLLALADEDEAAGVEDAPWPIHHPKQPGEPTRVQPSRARKRTD